MCSECFQISNLSEEYLAGLPPVFRKAMEDLYAGRIQDISPELTRSIAKELRDGVFEGFGPENVPAVSAAMERNIYVFSGFKTYQQLREASTLLYDGEGGIKPFSEFMRDVQGLNENYNINYLRAEYNHAVACGQMAENWQRIQERKAVVPLLKYKTAEDERVRQSHKALNDVIRPVDDPFWNTHYPPLDWNCRCHVVQIMDGVITKEFDDPKIPKMFQNNIGKDGIVFPDTHPYFNTNEEVRKKITSAAISLLAESVEPFTIIHHKNGKTLRAHITHIDSERLENIQVGKILVDLGFDVDLLPITHGYKIKNPDAKINQQFIADFKRPKKTRKLHNSIQNFIKEANKQGANFPVIYMPKEFLNIKEIIRGLMFSLSNPAWNKSVGEVWFIFEPNMLIKIDRNKINQTYYLQTLFKDVKQ